MRLSVVIPAHNEFGSIETVITEVSTVLEREGIDHEILVIDDASTDGTAAAVERMGADNPRIRCFRSHYSGGFGLTVRAGLDRFEGDAVAIMMADRSDDPEDLVRYHRLLEDGYDCAFGSRFVHGSRLYGYPRLKLVLNRLANWAIRLLFRHGYNDTTNAFKAYRREVIETVQPLFSNHFNLTVEIPLKAIVRGHSYGIIPVSWRNRAAGTSELSIQEMGSRYMFIILYVFLEHHLSRGDYRRPGAEAPRRGQLRPRREAQLTGEPRRRRSHAREGDGS